MRALTIMPPWTWVILEYNGPDPKRIENRNWNTDFRGDFLIHASKRYDEAGHKWIEEYLGIPLPREMHCGGIVGVARLVEVVAESKSRWFCGPFGWVLDKCYPYPFEACAGKLRWWEYPMGTEISPQRHREHRGGIKRGDAEGAEEEMESLSSED